MTANELRRMYVDFFKNKGHKVIASASLMPENDPTVLFTTAGMHPLIPYLLGEKHPLGRRHFMILAKKSAVKPVDRHVNAVSMLRYGIMYSWNIISSQTEVQN